MTGYFSHLLRQTGLGPPSAAPAVRSPFEPATPLDVAVTHAASAGPTTPRSRAEPAVEAPPASLPADSASVEADVRHEPERLGREPEGVERDPEPSRAAATRRDAPQHAHSTESARPHVSEPAVPVETRRGTRNAGDRREAEPPGPVETRPVETRPAVPLPGRPAETRRPTETSGSTETTPVAASHRPTEPEALLARVRAWVAETPAPGEARPAPIRPAPSRDPQAAIVARPHAEPPPAPSRPASPVPEQNLHLSIGTIRLALEAPAPSLPAPPAPAPPAPRAPDRTGARLGRRYLDLR